MSNGEDEDVTPYVEKLSGPKRRRMLKFLQTISNSSSETEGDHVNNLQCMPNSPISSGGFVWSHTTSTTSPGLSHGHRDGDRNENSPLNAGLQDELIPEPVLHNLEPRLNNSPDAVLCNLDAGIAHIPDIPDFPDPQPPDYGDDSDNGDTSEDELDELVNINDAGDPVPDEPLYPGAPLTRQQSYLAILAFISRHHLDRSSASDLIDLIDLHCPKPKDSYHNFLKHFDELNYPVETQIYCNGCLKPVPGRKSL